MKHDISKNITIEASTHYLPNHTKVEQTQYAFAYEVTIKNNSDENVKLINRYWLITNADGKKIEVKGTGVIGEQPVIAPGQSFHYTSGAIIDTPVGAMEGFYEMRLDNSEMIKTPIPPFGLSIPNAIN